MTVNRPKCTSLRRIVHTTFLQTFRYGILPGKTNCKMAKSLSLFERIKNIIKGGDIATISEFIVREVKKLERAIKTHETNLKNLELDEANKLENLQDSLDDAKQGLEDAYLSLSGAGEALKLNSDKDAYSRSFWNKVEAAEAEVKRVENQISNLKDSYKDKRDEIERAIAKCKGRIENLGETPMAPTEK